MVRVLLSLTILFALNANAGNILPQGSLSFSAKDSTEAEMSFTGEVEMERDHKPSKRDAKDQVEKQLMHLFGPMSAAETKAVPKGEHDIKIKSISKHDTKADTYVVEYDYEGIIVLEKGPKASYNIVLPVNPETVYQDAMRGNHNPCTDEHYQGEGDFWYFWNPYQTDCRLVKGKHFQVIHADIERIKNEKKTYPEYDRLPDKDGVIKISVLMGLDEIKSNRDPNTSRDVNATNFRLLRDWLKAAGYTPAKPADRKEISEIVPLSEARELPYVQTFIKKYKEVTIEILVFFGPTGIDEESTAFHYYFKDALENSAVMMYDGHSGLGGHLDLAGIESMRGFRFAPAKNRYQIYFFNSCSSYTYYNKMYFSRKRTKKDEDGTKNLDIMTNGLATYFSTIQDANGALLKAIDAWAATGKWTSYQELAKQIDSDNLFGVNGDEDNPKSPRK